MQKRHMRWFIAATIVLIVIITSCGDRRAQAAAPPVTKVLVFVEENHSLSEMQAQMPYTFSLAKQYGYATNYSAVTHPSLPNYLAIAYGSTKGVTDDQAPSAHPLTGKTVFTQAINVGRKAKVYAEDMDVNCRLTNINRYAVKHNPWAYASDDRTRCKNNDVPFSRFAADASAGTFPNAGMVIPNLCNDAHDCSLATADAWFKARMQTVFAGPDWKAGRLAVVLTADEDDRTQGNKVLTVVIHPSQSHKVVTTALNHYSLTRFYDDVLHAPRIGNAAGAASMSTAFGIPVG